MATCTVTYSFVNTTTADGPQVSQNFTDLTTFINGSVVHKDGTVAMTGLLTLPGPGVSANHAVTVAQLASGPPLQQLKFTTVSNDTAASTGVYEQWGTQVITIPNPGRTVGIVCWLTGYGNVTGGAATYDIFSRIDYSINGGGAYTASVATVGSATPSFPKAIISCTHTGSVTPTGSIIIRPMLRQDGGGGGGVTFTSGYLTCLMVPQ
jgi:hypothetical protein